MFKKINRLAKTKDVKLALARGRGFFNPFFTLKFLKTTRPNARLTVIASTKVAKKAVVRNRLKRVVREVMRQKLGDLPVGDYAVLLKPKAASALSVEVRSHLLALLASAKLIQR